MNKKVTILAAVIIVAAAGWLYLGKTAPRERTVNISLNYAAFDSFEEVLIKEEGLFEKHVPQGVSVKWHQISSGAEKRDALIAGALDITGMAVLTLATAIQNNIPVELLPYHGSNLYQLYARDPAIQSISDLKPEHKISVSSLGTGPQTAFLLAAQKDLGDVSRFKNSMIVMSNSDAITALIAGVPGVDAVVCTFPTIIAAWNSDKVHLVRDLSKEIVEYGVGGFLVVRPEYAKNNPDIMAAFMKAWNDALDLMHNNKAECVRIMLKVYKDIDEATAYRMLDYYVDTVDNGADHYDKLMSFLYDKGVLERPAVKFEAIPKYSPASK